MKPIDWVRDGCLYFPICCNAAVERGCDVDKPRNLAKSVTWSEAYGRHEGVPCLSRFHEKRFFARRARELNNAGTPLNTPYRLDPYRYTFGQ